MSRERPAMPHRYYNPNDPTETEPDEPFGRQPRPVTVTITGDPIDIRYWINELSRRAEFKGDRVQSLTYNTFKIYPRAVNE